MLLLQDFCSIKDEEWRLPQSLNFILKGMLHGLPRAYRPTKQGDGMQLPVEKAKCWWLLKIEPNACVGGSAVCVDLQAVRTLEFFGELYSLAKGFGPFLRGFGQALEKGMVIHQHFAVSTGICGVACCFTGL